MPRMYVVAVTIFLKPQHVNDFIAATLDNARNTRKEAGNIRFDVCRATDDPNRFILYEVYRGPEDIKAHQQTPHYQRWKQAVTDWMVKPRERAEYTALFFGDGEV